MCMHASINCYIIYCRASTCRWDGNSVLCVLCVNNHNVYQHSCLTRICCDQDLHRALYRTLVTLQAFSVYIPCCTWEGGVKQLVLHVSVVVFWNEAMKLHVHVVPKCFWVGIW